MAIYQDRRQAGKVLARYAQRDDVVVLALPRGGVPVAFGVAIGLGAPPEVLVRKLGAPGYPELAMGAVAKGGIAVLNRTVIEGLGLSNENLPPTFRPRPV